MATEEPTDESDDSRPDLMFGAHDDGAHQWRHPSEIGAMMALAHGIDKPPTPPARYSSVIRATSVAVSIAVLGATVVSLSSGGPTPATQLVSAGAGPIISNFQGPATTENVSRTVPVGEHSGAVSIERLGGHHRASGSGVVVFGDGYVATSRELVAGANRLVVRLPGGESYEAELIAGDYISNIAVLKIDAPGLAAAQFAERSPDVGDRVMVADAWLSEGVETRLTRVDQVVTDKYNFPRHELFEFHDTVGLTAAGAPLLDSDNKVIGLVIPIDAAPTFRYAIDITTVRSVSHQLIETGRATYVAWMGIKGLNAGDDKGALVETVVLNSPASMGGIEPGDIITSVARRNVNSFDDLQQVLKGLESRQVVAVELVRDGQPSHAEIRLGLRVEVE